MDGLLVARAPLHITFGNVSGLARDYERMGGTIVSTTVGYYVYAMVSFSALRGVQVVCGGQHLLLRRRGRRRRLPTGDLLEVAGSIVNQFNVRDGLTLFLAPQVTVGRSLGLVGSAAVAVVKVLAFCCGLDIAPFQVAEMAAHIEADKADLDAGLGEFYAAALGGINRLSFAGHDAAVEPLVLEEEARQELERGLMLFAIEGKKGLAMPQAAGQDNFRVEGHLKELAEISQNICDALRDGDLYAFGRLLDRSWAARSEVEKRTPFLERCYRTARKLGALGGDWSGGKEGGFLTLYCPDETQAAVTWAMDRLGLRRWPCLLECDGVQVMRATPWSRAHSESPMVWPPMAAPHLQSGKLEPSVRR